MGTMTEINVPDIGEYKDIPVIEILVKPGDTIKADDTLVTLESDKATMDVPAPVAGVVKAVKVRIGDKVSEGSALLTVEAEGATAGAGAAAAAEPARPSVAAPPAPTHAPAGTAEVRVPDIGDFKNVPVIEIFVKPGDTVKPEQSLVSLESDKATMDVPAPFSGVVQELRVKVGDKVSEGTTILVLADAADEAAP
ncbi:MAG TPA: biotin/lipoyl-containing protein, partial [Burkholderiales bacterium]|nr:biotin/lipoyl-containing protein [Burkholderiales bacterium]